LIILGVQVREEVRWECLHEVCRPSELLD